MNPTTRARPREGSILSYSLGFAGSLLCTLAAYALVVTHAASASALLVAVVVFALAQLVIQLMLFLHLGKRGNAMNRVTFALALVIVFIVVAGALWIMATLNARMMPSTSQMLQYVQNQEGL